MNDRRISLVSGLELWRWRQQAREAAKLSEIPLAEVDWLLQDVTGLDRLALRLESFKDRPQIELQMPLPVLTQLWQRRTRDRLPVQYLTGIAPWRHFSLAVSPAVLIPRPETECLIDLAVAAANRGRRGEGESGRGREKNANVPFSPNSQFPIPNSQSPTYGHWADLGTGSGAIALGLAEVFPSAIIHAVDCSSAALAIAKKNAQAVGLVDRVQFYHGSWWEPLAALKGQLSGMVANPPYIPTSMVSSLQPEVALHEPHLALDGGSDGLDFIRHLVETTPDYLRVGGIWLIEMMAGQASAVVELLQKQGSYCKVEIYADLAGIERFALAYRS